MLYSVHLSGCGTYIHCRANGVLNQATAREFMTAARKVGGETGINCYLIDFKGVPNIDTAQANYDFAHKGMAQMGVEHDNRVAILVSPGDTSHDLVVSAACQAGYRIALFTALEKAIVWLKQQPDSKESG